MPLVLASEITGLEPLSVYIEQENRVGASEVHLCRQAQPAAGVHRAKDDDPETQAGSVGRRSRVPPAAARGWREMRL